MLKGTEAFPASLQKRTKSFFITLNKGNSSCIFISDLIDKLQHPQLKQTHISVKRIIGLFKGNGLVQPQTEIQVFRDSEPIRHNFRTNALKKQNTWMFCSEVSLWVSLGVRSDHCGDSGSG